VIDDNDEQVENVVSPIDVMPGGIENDVRDVHP
jgi:hypothetical protein